MVSNTTRTKWVRQAEEIICKAVAGWPSPPVDSDERYYKIREKMRRDAELWTLLPAIIRRPGKIAGIIEALSIEGLIGPQVRIHHIQAEIARTLRELVRLPDAKAADVNSEQNASTAIIIDDFVVESKMEPPAVFSPSNTSRRGISSSAWTGRRTISEQASYVKELVPDAVTAIESLISEQEAMRRHNHPPEALEDERLAALRALRDALTELLDAADREQPMEDAMGRVKACFTAVFQFANDMGQSVKSFSPTYAAVLAAGFTTFGICSFFTTMSADGAAAMTGGVLAATGSLANKKSR